MPLTVDKIARRAIHTALRRREKSLLEWAENYIYSQLDGGSNPELEALDFIRNRILGLRCPLCHKFHKDAKHTLAAANIQDFPLIGKALLGQMQDDLQIAKVEEPISKKPKKPKSQPDYLNTKIKEMGGLTINEIKQKLGLN